MSLISSTRIICIGMTILIELLKIKNLGECVDTQKAKRNQAGMYWQCQGT